MTVGSDENYANKWNYEIKVHDDRRKVLNDISILHFYLFNIQNVNIFFCEKSVKVQLTSQNEEKIPITSKKLEMLIDYEKSQRLNLFRLDHAFQKPVTKCLCFSCFVGVVDNFSILKT